MAGFSGLRARLVLLVLIAALPAFGLVLWTSLDARQGQSTHAEENARSLAQTIANQQGQFVEGTRQILGMLAGLTAQSLTTTGSQPVDSQACERAFAGILAQDVRYANMGILNSDGSVLCSGVQGSSVNAAGQPWFQEALSTKEFSIGGYQIESTTGKQSIAFGDPVVDASGQVRALLFATVDLSWLNAEAARIELPKNASVRLVDRDGVYLVRQPHPEAYVGTKAADTDLIAKAFASGGSLGERKGPDGIERLYAAAPVLDVADQNLLVSVGLSTHELYGPLDRALWRNIGLLAGVTLLALLAAWFFGDRLIVRDVASLERVAQRVALGDLGARTQRAYGRGELGQLARSFDEMAKSLQERDAARDRAERAMQQSEARFRAFVVSAADGIIMVGEDGLISTVNPAAEQMFGYPGAELIGQPVEMLLSPDLSGRHVDHRQAFWREPAARSMGAAQDVRARRRDGSEFPVDISLAPLQTAEGQLVAATVTDITARKRAEEDLAQRAEELARSNAELEQFAYVASHDLQEPLRMVGNYTQLLARRYKGRLDGDADEFINFAVEGARRMQELINDLLAFSRVGRRGKEAVPVSTETALSQTLANLKASIEESDATVTHDELPVVLADETQVGQLLQNLIGNALKFHGDRAPQIHVSARRQGGEWVFSVRDNGIGIAPEYHERIFVIFQRLHTRDRYRGTGMGLAIAKKIVERHGGRIWVESDDGNGTTFYFTLPAVDSSLAAAA